MDLRAEFDIPPSNGEVIELESAGEKEDKPTCDTKI